MEAALSTSPTEALRTAEPRKPTIGARKPAGPKKGGVRYFLAVGSFDYEVVSKNFETERKNACARSRSRHVESQNSFHYLV